jgi:hypothetical protein
MNTQFGESLDADFQENTWTFEMPVPFSVCAGEFAIVPRAEYDALIERAKPSFNGELILTLESKDEWIRKVPRRLPEKNYYNEHFIWIDANGNTLVMGEDFAAAEKIGSYPVKVYRHTRVSDVAKENNQTNEQ